MTFRATFIGVNKHADPGIPERDASALHALFTDTFDTIHATLLLDQAATLDAIRSALDDSLGQATEDLSPGMARQGIRLSLTTPTAMRQAIAPFRWRNWPCDSN